MNDWLHENTKLVAILGASFTAIGGYLTGAMDLTTAVEQIVRAIFTGT